MFFRRIEEPCFTGDYLRTFPYDVKDRGLCRAARTLASVIRQEVWPSRKMQGVINRWALRTALECFPANVRRHGVLMAVGSLSRSIWRCLNDSCLVLNLRHLYFELRRLMCGGAFYLPDDFHDDINDSRID